MGDAGVSECVDTDSAPQHHMPCTRADNTHLHFGIAAAMCLAPSGLMLLLLRSKLVIAPLVRDGGMASTTSQGGIGSMSACHQGSGEVASRGKQNTRPSFEGVVPHSPLRKERRNFARAIWLQVQPGEIQALLVLTRAPLHPLRRLAHHAPSTCVLELRGMP